MALCILKTDSPDLYNFYQNCYRVILGLELLETTAIFIKNCNKSRTLIKTHYEALDIAAVTKYITAFRLNGDMPFEKDDILKTMFRDNAMIEHID